MTPDKICTIPGCDGKLRYSKWCNKHYLRNRTHGDPLATSLEWDPITRLKRDVTVTPEGCWIYNGKDPCSNGYQRWYVGGKRYMVHRWTYEHVVGPIPDGLQIDHLCRNPPCCNPDHLRAVTGRENVLSSPTAPPAINARKTHCKRNHEFTEANTHYRPNGARHCRTCRNAAARRHQAAKRAAA